MIRVHPEFHALLVALSFLPALSHSFDAEFCGRGTQSAEELDRGHWERYENVYIALVEKAELVRSVNIGTTVYFSVSIDEVFKGAPETTSSIGSRRTLNEWKGDVQEIMMGGWIDVFVGDRLLVFSNPNDDVVLGLCSASRVIEQGFVGIDDEAASTLRRLERWRDAP